MSVGYNARLRKWESRWRQGGRQRAKTFNTERLARRHDSLMVELMQAGHLDGLAIERAPDGTWEVAWTDQRLDRHRRGFDTKKEATAFEGLIVESRRLGRPTDGIDVGTQTVAEFMAAVWVPERFANLAPNSQRLYTALWRRHLADTFDHVQLRDVTAASLRRWRDDRVAAGAGPKALNQALTLFGGILQRAVVQEQIPSNPARIIDREKETRAEAVVPMSPATVEAVRVHARDQFDATLIGVLAYAGLRPSEAWALRWGDLQERTLLIQRATDGEGGVKSTKTSKARTVRLLGPLAQDLAEWRIAQGRPADGTLVFPSRRRDFGVSDLEEQAAWRKHRWGKAWRAARELDPAMSERPPKVYALRHSFVSLLLAAGRQPHDVARQLGRDPSETISRYGHVIDEWAGEDVRHRDPEAEIRAARERARATAVRPSHLEGAVG